MEIFVILFYLTYILVGQLNVVVVLFTFAFEIGR
jgi:hypothetical protein